MASGAGKRFAVFLARPSSAAWFRTGRNWSLWGETSAGVQASTWRKSKPRSELQLWRRDTWPARLVEVDLSERMTSENFKAVGKTNGFAQPAVLCLLLVAVTLIVYWPVTRCDFVNYDDPDYFSSNSHVQAGLTSDNVAWAFGTGRASNWHPLTWLSLMLDRELSGCGPAGPHFTNLLFHLANTVLLFLLLRRLTRATWRSAFVAALFALHPLHVESVAWISERKDVLSTFFGLLALLGVCALRAEGQKCRRQDRTGEHPIRPTSQLQPS